MAADSERPRDASEEDAEVVEAKGGASFDAPVISYNPVAVIRSRPSHVVGCAWFWAWAVVGAAAALTVVSFIGTLTALPVAFVAFLMARNPGIRKSAFGVISGAGALFLVIAWINRTGESFDPRPWLVIGSVCFMAGIVGHALNERRTG